MLADLDIVADIEHWTAQRAKWERYELAQADRARAMASRKTWKLASVATGPFPTTLSPDSLARLQRLLGTSDASQWIAAVRAGKALDMAPPTIEKLAAGKPCLPRTILKAERALLEWAS